MDEHRKRPIASVHVDIAEFLWDTEKIMRMDDAYIAEWFRNLRECLATRNPRASEFGAKLLGEAEEFRRFDRERKREKKNEQQQNQPPGNGQPPPVSPPGGQPDRRAEGGPVQGVSDGPLGVSGCPPVQPVPDSEVAVGGGRKSRKRATGKANSVTEELFGKFFGTYPGNKEARAVAFQRFLRVAGAEAESIAERLMDAIENEKRHKEQLSKTPGAFVAQWKNISTWINNRCWDQVLSFEIVSQPRQKTKGDSLEESAIQFMRENNIPFNG